MNFVPRLIIMLLEEDWLWDPPVIMLLDVNLTDSRC
jgi:hypothetical protein